MYNYVNFSNAWGSLRDGGRWCGNLCYLWMSSGNSGENSSCLELVLQKEVRLSLGLSGGVVYLILGEVRGRGMGWPSGGCGANK